MKAPMPAWVRILLRALMALLGLVFLAYLVVKAHRGGNDINVYLHAAGQLLQHENIYTGNPFNFYLYSPLFALLLSPLSWLDMSVARVIWMLINVALAVRLWYLIRTMLPATGWHTSKLWSVPVVILSLGFLNHNFVLGQVTILILWLTVEGIVRIMSGRQLTGALCIALGINFKIIPLLALVYLGVKGNFKAILFVLLLIGGSVILPGLFTGFAYNFEMHKAWLDTIDPAGERYVFEDIDGCHSLNAILPAFFYDFSSEPRNVKPYVRNVHYPRMIVAVPHDLLAVILQFLRLLVLGICIYVALPGSWLKGPLRTLPSRLRNTIVTDWHTVAFHPQEKPSTLLRDIGVLCLATLLIFPHQMKYTMLYFVPAGAWIIWFFLRKHESGRSWTLREKILCVFSSLLMFVLAIMGRDIIGDYLVDILDYYHFMGICNLVFLGILVWLDD